MSNPSGEMEQLTPRVVLLVEYDGTPYFGSQYQHHHGKVIPTVQHTLQQALERLNIPASPVTCASRTDTGVHAEGQVCHFDLLSPTGLKLSIDDLPSALNAHLPSTVSVQQMAYTSSRRFHSRREAQHKWYRYTVFNRRERSAFCSPGTIWVRHSLDTEKMDLAARLLEGTHNFASFKCSNTPVLDDICHVSYARVHRHGDWVYFDIAANRFLYKMIRNLMGVLLEIGDVRKDLSPSLMEEVLIQQKRLPPWPTAKPGGLTLKAISYPEPFHFFQEHPNAQTLHQLIMESKQNENLFRKAS